MLWDGDALLGAEREEQYAKDKENEVDGQETKAVGAHILLRLTQVLAREIFLHHILIQSRHNDDDDYTAEKLSPERLCAFPSKNAAQWALADRGEYSVEVQSESANHCPQDAAEGEEHTERLQSIGAHNGLDAAAARVEPDEQQCDESGERIGDAERFGNELLEHEYHEVESRGCTGEFAKEEEECPCSVGVFPKAFAQISVDGGELEAIVERQEQESYGYIAKEKAGAHLKVRHLRCAHPARYGNERYARDAGAYHTKSYHPPR